jgi:predicted dienelactone hydrolase
MVDRSRHVSRVTDFVLTGWKDHGHVDGGRIGIFGFSAGGTTALIAAGGVPDLGRIGPECAAHPEFVCKLSKPGVVFVDPPASAWTHDPRIAAAVVAAPGLGFTFEPSGLSAVKAPVQLWIGTEDHAVPYATNAGIVRNLLPNPPDFHNVPGAQHTSFLAPCGLIGVPRLCKEAPGFDRKAFHRDFNRSVTAFFKAHLTATSPPRPGS